ncbi:MAG: thiamine pyrophosphate-dependent enzyme [Bacteroidales bacterium]|jgi:2-oxoisovalerate dehydrogenase E1 component|nr:thiamine pyrophosphate-dependent enzyme [Bacteroidales bacterium]
MVVIREFETMLNLIKTTNEYNGLSYNHPGPAHLSIGQEASAVGMAYNLNIEDFIFGSHRSHGEILAKGLSSIKKLDEDNLYTIMSSYFGGTALRVVEKDFQGNIKDLAELFLLYGALAEIFARENGFNKGLGGSMHAFFTPFGIYPNNAIVGGSGDISVGAGVNPEMMHAERVDGYNPLAVIDAFKRKKKLLSEKRGPVLLDTLTYRISSTRYGVRHGK